jgi:hypothetical protein
MGTPNERVSGPAVCGGDYGAFRRGPIVVLATQYRANQAKHIDARTRAQGFPYNVNRVARNDMHLSAGCTQRSNHIDDYLGASGATEDAVG